MLGAIFGDIVGSIYERHNVERTDFQLITRYSHPTDDSIMTLAVAKALMETYVIIVYEYIRGYLRDCRSSRVTCTLPARKQSHVHCQASKR